MSRVLAAAAKARHESHELPVRDLELVQALDLGVSIGHEARPVHVCHVPIRFVGGLESAEPRSEILRRLIGSPCDVGTGRRTRGRKERDRCRACSPPDDLPAAQHGGIIPSALRHLRTWIVGLLASDRMVSRGIGPLEAEVLDVLWDAAGWLTPGEVHDVISVRKGLAYTTIMTVLSNLCEKGVLERRRDGRAFAYHPVQTREERTASTMTSALKAVENRPVVLTEFVGQLSDADRAQLRRMLSQ